MTPSYRLSKMAQKDTRNIGRYTQKKWGAAQRRLYLSGMEQKFIQLAENPKLSPERAEFEPPVRIYHFEKHLIIYVGENSGILVVRVLHESMDVPTHISNRRSS